jgi:hypothetical protein
VLITVLLRWRPAALAAIAAAVILGPGDLELRHLIAPTAVSRRLLIIAAVPLYFYVAAIVTSAPGLPTPLLDLPLVALAGVAVLVAARVARTRTRRRAASGGGASRAAGG